MLSILNILKSLARDAPLVVMYLTFIIIIAMIYFKM